MVHAVLLDIRKYTNTTTAYTAKHLHCKANKLQLPCQLACVVHYRPTGCQTQAE